MVFEIDKLNTINFGLYLEANLRPVFRNTYFPGFDYIAAHEKASPHHPGFCFCGRDYGAGKVGFSLRGTISPNSGQ